MVDLNQNKGVYPREKDKTLNDAADKRDMIAKWKARFPAEFASIPDTLFGGETKVVIKDSPESIAFIEEATKANNKMKDDIKGLELNITQYKDERAELRNKVGNLAGDLLERDDKIKKLKAKEVGVRKEVDKLIGINEGLALQNKNIKNKLADALNAEQEAKKDLEQLNINIDKAQAEKEAEAKTHLEMEVIEAKKSKLQAELDKLA